MTDASTVISSRRDTDIHSFYGPGVRFLPASTWQNPGIPRIILRRSSRFTFVPLVVDGDDHQLLAFRCIAHHFRVRNLGWREEDYIRCILRFESEEVIITRKPSVAMIAMTGPGQEPFVDLDLRNPGLTTAGAASVNISSTCSSDILVNRLHFPELLQFRGCGDGPVRAGASNVRHKLV